MCKIAHFQQYLTVFGLEDSSITLDSKVGNICSRTLFLFCFSVIG